MHRAEAQLQQIFNSNLLAVVIKRTTA